ncbi:Tad domain-containing protein [Lederbergia citrea]|uniref:Tad domain-containing protein n=1 Tax=Lederbergia citrea TaxID=2833581 RepID=UPI001BCA0BFB|nr:Tad domain-containing protein [Lederbergia citrea]MBS4206158.1 Tad domain-containing protein [Lederbergia citrea]
MKNEDGNAVLFMLGLLSIMMILFMLVVNMTQVLAVKEQANTTSQQASLAATSVLYEEIWYSIDEYERSLIGMIESYPETIREKVDKRITQLRSNHSYRNDSDNEIRRKAINQVISEQLRSGIGKEALRNQLENDIRFKIIPKMKTAAVAAIVANNGNVNEAEMQVFKDERIYVKASNNVEGSAYNKYFSGIKKKLFQESAGPKVDFVSQLSISQTIKLN